MLQKLLIATSNAGKVGKYREYLADLPIELVSLKDLGLTSIEETGSTLEENALLKVRTYFNQSGLPCIGDDGGLEIDALNGEPGIKSRRWKSGDENATDEELVAYTFEKMQGVPPEMRIARFKTAVAFIDAKGKETMLTTAIEGYIPEQASEKIEEGLPFHSVLFIPRFEKMWSELTKEEFDQVDQRVQAINKLKPIIATALLADKKRAD